MPRRTNTSALQQEKVSPWLEEYIITIIRCYVSYYEKNQPWLLNVGHHTVSCRTLGIYCT